MYDNKDLKRSSESLYNDIDDCISDIVKARLQKDDEAEGRALFMMESLMVATLQQLSCIIDHLEEEEQEPDIENDLDDYLEIAHDILEKAFDEEQGYQTDDGVSEHQTAIKAVKDAMKEQKPLSSEETELNSIAFLEQIGYTCIPPGKEQKPEIKYVYPIFRIGDTIKPKVYNQSHRINKIKDDNYVLDNGFTFPVVDQDMWEIVEQPTEWSEEDEKVMDSIIEYIDSGNIYATSKVNMITWLKFLPERFNLQPKSEWSEEDNDARELIYQQFPELNESEDELIRKRLINLIKELAAAKLPIATGGYFIDGQDRKYIAYLEKQKEQSSTVDDIAAAYQLGLARGRYEQKPAECITDSIKFEEGFKTGRELGFREGVESVNVKPAEWSEEDKKCIQSIISCLKYLKTQDTERRWNGDHNAHPEHYAELITKLQSIFSRTHWKPSEEQMEALDNARFCKSYDRSELDSLYTELKKQYDRH